jgi:hypothetical protein
MRLPKKVSNILTPPDLKKCLDLDARAELEKIHKEKDKQRAVLKGNYDNMKKEYNVLRSKEVDLTHQYEVRLESVAL